jgi:hypothetical protein
MDPSPTPRTSDGRSLGWRVRTAAFGAILGGAGWAVVRWPQAIVWAVGGVLGALGLLLVVSAVAAKGR